MHEMMGDRYVANPALLLTTPAVNSASDDDLADKEMGDAEASIQPLHGRNLPNLFDLVDLDGSASSNTASQVHRSPTPATQLAPGLSSGASLPSAPSTPTASPFGAASSTPATPTSTGKRKRGAVEQKKDAIADAFYRSQVDNMQYRLQLEQEKTKREQMRVQAMENQTAAMLRIQDDQCHFMNEMLRLLVAANGSHSGSGSGSGSSANADSQ
ncbi:uncharacterized protein SRS1_16556 [Sporisorium reilianum f. sp. reilianum]|uniref:Uncharacterized protein n=1 Tax=Sporisorium reilianum f. sp. reilianum TaxID=72559 RepID=A0A2N8UD26_9BASI|nr:uncharacterized protein SRS1_16556 [Sporisorium reilianum f. sp. reilianum]